MYGTIRKLQIYGRYGGSHLSTEERKGNRSASGGHGHASHPDVLFASFPPIFLRFLRAGYHLAGSPAIHPELETQEEVAGALENTADLEHRRDVLGAEEEVAHLHRVTNNPRRDHGQPETLARAGLIVGPDLGQREGGLDGQANAAKDTDVDVGLGDRSEVDHEQGEVEVYQEQPVSASKVSETGYSWQLTYFPGALTAWCSATAKSHMALRNRSDVR